MNRKMVILILISILLITNFLSVSSTVLDKNTDRVKSEFTESLDVSIIPNQIIVKFNKKLDFSLQKSTIYTMGIKSIDDLNKEFKVTEIKQLSKATSNSDLSNIYTIKIDELIDPLLVANEYENNPNVEYAEPNILFESYAMPNDEYFDQQWALYQSNDCDIDATDAWDITTGSKDAVIAIIDTGVYYEHPDLSGNILVNPGEDINGNGIIDDSDFNEIDDDNNGFIDDIRGYDFVDFDVSLFLEDPTISRCLDEDYLDEDNNPIDKEGHGTHCAGIVGAVGNNNNGISGVCWDCSIMPVRAGFKISVLGQVTGVFETDDLYESIIYAADNEADVISMSWGNAYYSKLILDAVNYAYSKGVVLVAAAGNSDSDSEHYPAAYDHVIAVAATDRNDIRADFSNYGKWVDVASPGVDIISTIIPNKLYETYSGTSMACPYVAGVAGLLKSKYPDAHPDLITSLIKTGVDEIESSGYKYIGTGRVNAYKIFTVKPIFAFLNPVTNYQNVKGMLEIKGSANGEKFKNYEISYGEGREVEEWKTILFSTDPVSHGGKLATLDTEELKDGFYTIKLTVEANDGGLYTEITTITVNNVENQIIYVDDDNTQGPWEGTTSKPYAYLQDGIDAASDNEEVHVKKGTYWPSTPDGEGSFIIDRKIKLIGEDNLETTITHNGKQRGAFIQVVANNVEISNCNIISQSNSFDFGNGGVILQSDNNYLHDNRLYGLNMYGFITLEQAFDNIIEDNLITSEGDSYTTGIKLWGSDNNIIQRNAILGKSNMELRIVAGSRNNLIENNTIENSKCGIEIYYAFENNIKNNTIKGNSEGNQTGTGIKLEKTYGNTITGNKISGKSKGMHCEEAYENIISYNNFSYNKNYGIHLDHYWHDGFFDDPHLCEDNELFCNIFIENGKANARDDGNNKWCKINAGNYWDDYEGTDGNDDGIGDQDYVIKGLRQKHDEFGDEIIEEVEITHKDKYPLMEPVQDKAKKSKEKPLFVECFERYSNILSFIRLILRTLEAF